VLLTRAEVHERVGDLELAQADLEHAVELLTRGGSRFWAARAHLVGASVDRRRSEYHRRTAHRLAGADAHDPAWVHLLRGRGALHIKVLGIAAVTVDGAPVHLSTRAELETLAMLALRPEGISLTTIADRLWPEEDPERVTHRLDNLISSLRGALLPTTRLRRAHGMLVLDLAPDECDALDAVRRAQALLDAPPPAGRTSKTASATTRHAAALADELRQPVLAGHDAPWIGLESGPLHRLATSLDRLAG
jgi:hypothetical protein